MIASQLGGKFSTEDSGIFDLKKILTKAGIKIHYPKGNSIILVQNGVPLTFDPNIEKKSFHEIEISYLESVKNSDIHIVHNKHLNNYGYIGESASVELAYAIIHNKPICLLYPPAFSCKVDVKLQKIINQNSHLFLIKDLMKLSTKKLKTTLSKYISKNVKYKLNVLEEKKIYDNIKKTLNSYKTLKND